MRISISCHLQVCLVEVSKAEDRSGGVEGNTYPGKQGRSVWFVRAFLPVLFEGNQKLPSTLSI